MALTKEKFKDLIRNFQASKAPAAHVFATQA